MLIDDDAVCSAWLLICSTSVSALWPGLHQPGRGGQCATRVAPSAPDPAERRYDQWNEDPSVTKVVNGDPTIVEAALRAGRFLCGCGSSLAPWGHARTRSLRGLGGQLRCLRPRRARCPSCGVTTVLLANWSLPRRRDTIDVIGSALTAHAGGAGHRPTARRLGVPDATVRGWLRRARSRTERLRVLGTVVAHDHDPMLPAIKPTATSFGDAIEALSVAARAIRMRHGGDHPGGWPAIVALTHGLLLSRSWS